MGGLLQPYAAPTSEFHDSSHTNPSPSPSTPPTMILLRRAPNGAPRALASLTRPSPRPARTSPPPRFSSTTATPPPSSADADAAAKPTPQPDQQQQQQQQAPPPRRHRRSLRPLIYSTLFLAAGLVTGNIVRFTIAPPPLPDPDTDMDDALQGKLREELDALPQVREHERLTATEAEWVEVGPWGALVARSRADSGVDVGGKKEWFGGWLGGEEREKEGGEVVVFEGLLGDEKHAVSQTLAAMKGFGPARKFVNRATRETVLVFWVGGGLTGWPGVAHGGALATAFLEAFGCKASLFALSCMARAVVRLLILTYGNSS